LNENDYHFQMNEVHYNDKSIFFAETPSQDGVIVVRALVFYEGTQTDSLGKKIEYSQPRLQRIVDNSNRALSEGGRIPLFKDHRYNQDSVIGQIVGRLTLEDITADNLPSEGLDRLIGKKGIYAQVQISGEENVVKYGDGRIKTLSVGIDLIKERIYEISAVPFPAVAGASLFEEYGLSMDKTMEERKTPMMFFDLFMETVRNIDQSTETDKDALKTQAIADFTNKLRESLGLVNKSVIPLFNEEIMEPKEKEPSPVVDEAAIAQYETMQARINELESAQARYQDKMAQLERTNEITTKFAELKDRAVVLRDGGKMTPAAYKEYFGEPKAAIATYSAPVADGGKDIEAVEAIVSYLETYGAPVVTFGRSTPMEELEPDDSEEIDATAKRVLSKVGI
jgi:hypothetical protein